MKKAIGILAVSSALLFGACSTQEVLSGLNSVMNSGSQPWVPNEQDAGLALKEALTNGVSNGVDILSLDNAFYNDQAIRILLPPEVKGVESKLRKIGLGNELDKAVKSLNTAAEKATSKAKPIFVDAITSMSFSDALGILTGGDGSATNYLRRKTTSNLKRAYRPEIKTSLDKVNATKYWSDIFNTYNQIPLVKDINPDLPSYVTDKAIYAMFREVEKVENDIRKDPIKRVSDLLQKAFGYADGQK